MRKTTVLLTTLLVLMLAASVFAGSFPEKPVQLIVPYPAGGATDLISRAIAASISSYLGQPMVVVVKSGCSGTIGTAYGAAAKPDGYTVTQILVGPTAIQVHQQNLPYDGINAFEPVALLSKNPIYFSVRADSPWKTLDDFIADAKANPMKLKYAHSGTGALPNLNAENFLKKAGIKAIAMPFNGGNPAVTAMLGGHADAAVSFGAEIAEHVRAGNVRILGVFTEERTDLFPDAPTFKEQGFDITAVSWRGLAVPKGTPPERVAILHEAVKKVLEDPSFQAMMKQMKETINYLPPEEFKKMAEKDYQTFKGIFGK